MRLPDTFEIMKQLISGSVSVCCSLNLWEIVNFDNVYKYKGRHLCISIFLCIYIQVYFAYINIQTICDKHRCHQKLISWFFCNILLIKCTLLTICYCDIPVNMIELISNTFNTTFFQQLILVSILLQACPSFDSSPSPSVDGSTSQTPGLYQSQAA